MTRVSMRADAGGRWGGCPEGRDRRQEAHLPAVAVIPGGRERLWTRAGQETKRRGWV